MWSRIATQKKTNENTVTGATNSMIRVEVQCRWEGDLYGSWDGGAKPLWEGSKRRGIPPIPLFSRGRTGVMGRHGTQSIRDGTGRDSGCLQLVFEQRWRTPYLTICQCYRKKFI